MTGKELIGLLKKNGWTIDRIQGSHYIMKKDGKIEVVPYHGRDLKKGTLNKILKNTGFK